MHQLPESIRPSVCPTTSTSNIQKFSGNGLSLAESYSRSFVFIRGLKFGRFRTPVINPVEEQLERPVRLRPEGHLGPIDHQLAFAHRRLGDPRRPFQIRLAP